MVAAPGGSAPARAAGSPPGPVRAIARVGGGSAGQRKGVATLTPHRRPGFLGPVHVLQLLVLEAAVVTVAASWALGAAAVTIAGIVAAVVVVVTLTRRGGRWWLQHWAMSWRLRKREAAAGATGGGDPRLAGLRLLAPGVSIEDVSGPDGAGIGVGRDGAGWFAAAEIANPATAREAGRDPVPLDVLATALADADQSGCAVAQLVVHTVPAAVADDEASRSYQELMRRYGSTGVPLDQTTWIAVRLDTAALAGAGADLPDRAADVVAALLRALTKALRRGGITTRLLDRDELLNALDRSCDLTADGAGGTGYQFRIGSNLGATPREDWRGWRSGRLSHRTYWLRRWPSVAHAGVFIDSLGGTPAAFTSVALTLVPHGDEADIRCLVRVATAPDRLKQAAESVRASARAARAELFPLDGEQRPAVYATAPTGGGAR